MINTIVSLRHNINAYGHPLIDWGLNHRFVLFTDKCWVTAPQSIFWDVTMLQVNELLNSVRMPHIVNGLLKAHWSLGKMKCILHSSISKRKLRTLASIFGYWLLRIISLRLTRSPMCHYQACKISQSHCNTFTALNDLLFIHKLALNVLNKITQLVFWTFLILVDPQLGSDWWLLTYY